ncbi:hypothetical protein EDD15DRAFT_2198842 [Pisolithus albus]|nr:hypothetical protein EDD15DRAFT_2198842 [Pisolithus albus]
MSFCTKLQREGMVFRTVSRSPRDANVIVWDTHSREKCTAARILALFIDTTATASPTPSFAVIERHVELSQKDEDLDPYRRFGFPVAGALYYDKFHPPEVVSSSKLVTQFAKTVFVYEPLNNQVAHVLPIFKPGYSQPSSSEFGRRLQVRRQFDPKPGVILTREVPLSLATTLLERVKGNPGRCREEQNKAPWWWLHLSSARPKRKDFQMDTASILTLRGSVVCAATVSIDPSGGELKVGSPEHLIHPPRGKQSIAIAVTQRFSSPWGSDLDVVLCARRLMRLSQNSLEDPLINDHHDRLYFTSTDDCVEVSKAIGWLSSPQSRAVSFIAVDASTGVYREDTSIASVIVPGISERVFLRSLTSPHIPQLLVALWAPLHQAAAAWSRVLLECSVFTVNKTGDVELKLQAYEQEDVAMERRQGCSLLVRQSDASWDALFTFASSDSALLDRATLHEQEGNKEVVTKVEPLIRLINTSSRDFLKMMNAPRCHTYHNHPWLLLFPTLSALQRLAICWIGTGSLPGHLRGKSDAMDMLLTKSLDHGVERGLETIAEDIINGILSGCYIAGVPPFGTTVAADLSAASATCALSLVRWLIDAGYQIAGDEAVEESLFVRKHDRDGTEERRQVVSGYARTWWSHRAKPTLQAGPYHTHILTWNIRSRGSDLDALLEDLSGSAVSISLALVNVTIPTTQSSKDTTCYPIANPGDALIAPLHLYGQVVLRPLLHLSSQRDMLVLPRLTTTISTDKMPYSDPRAFCRRSEKNKMDIENLAYLATCAWKRILLVNKERLETFYGKEIIITDRGMVETHAEEILYGADKQDVSLLVVDGLSCSSPTHARNLIRSAIAYVRVIWDWD